VNSTQIRTTHCGDVFGANVTPEPVWTGVVEVAHARTTRRRVDEWLALKTRIGTSCVCTCSNKARRAHTYADTTSHTVRVSRSCSDYRTGQHIQTVYTCRTVRRCDRGTIAAVAHHQYRLIVADRMDSPFLYGYIIRKHIARVTHSADNTLSTVDRHQCDTNTQPGTLV
jgi:hypothetical protein